MEKKLRLKNHQLVSAEQELESWQSRCRFHAPSTAMQFKQQQQQQKGYIYSACPLYQGYHCDFPSEKDQLFRK